jgi:hypothetical protein
MSLPDIQHPDPLWVIRRQRVKKLAFYSTLVSEISVIMVKVQILLSLVVEIAT